MLGEKIFEAEGKTFRLVFSVNALCALEDLLGQDVLAVGAQLSSGSGKRLNLLRAMFWAGLQEHHDDLDLKAAGRLMSVVGVEKLGGIIAEAFKAAFPQAAKAADAEAGEADADPPAPAAGTGKTSSSAT